MGEVFPTMLWVSWIPRPCLIHQATSVSTIGPAIELALSSLHEDVNEWINAAAYKSGKFVILYKPSLCQKHVW